MTQTSHRRHFDALRADFKNLGIEVDPACSDVSRLRFYSYDHDPVFNLEATPYQKLPPRALQRRRSFLPRADDSLELLINLVVSTGQDITSSYHDWLCIGGALASIYGEAGRDKFHLLSQFYHAYSLRATDKQFNACLRNRPNFSPGIIFLIAKKHGISLKSLF